MGVGGVSKHPASLYIRTGRIWLFFFFNGTTKTRQKRPTIKCYCNRPHHTNERPNFFLCTQRCTISVASPRRVAPILLADSCIKLWKVELLLTLNTPLLTLHSHNTSAASLASLSIHFEWGDVELHQTELWILMSSCQCRFSQKLGNLQLFMLRPHS